MRLTNQYVSTFLKELSLHVCQLPDGRDEYRHARRLLDAGWTLGRADPLSHLPDRSYKALNKTKAKWSDVVQEAPARPI